MSDAQHSAHMTRLLLAMPTKLWSTGGWNTDSLQKAGIYTLAASLLYGSETMRGLGDAQPTIWKHDVHALC